MGVCTLVVGRTGVHGMGSGAGGGLVAVIGEE